MTQYILYQEKNGNLVKLDEDEDRENINILVSKMLQYQPGVNLLLLEKAGLGMKITPIKREQPMKRLSECPICGYDGIDYGAGYRYCEQCGEDLDVYRVTLPCCGVRILPHPCSSHRYCAYCGGAIPEGLISPRQ